MVHSDSFYMVLKSNRLKNTLLASLHFSLGIMEMKGYLMTFSDALVLDK